jgi:hypothetical protein
VGARGCTSPRSASRKYFLRKRRESEPFYESMALNMLGIEKLKAMTAD